MERHEDPSMNRRTVIFSTAALALAAGTGLTFSNGALSPVGIALAQEEQEVDTSRVIEMTLGNPDAAVTVIEYAMFTCPHCRTFHEGPFKELKANYIDTGKIHFIYREVYFNGPALWAGLVARCAGEERYFAMVDLLFQNQEKWLASGDPATIGEELKKLGLSAGLSEEQVNSCLQDEEMARALVAVFQTNAEADQIDATPTFVINGEKYSNMSYEEFAGIIDEKLGG
jgi:protein-disulfide isomerase